MPDGEHPPPQSKWHVGSKLIFFFVWLTGCTSYAWIPLFYEEVLHLTKSQIGILTGLTPLVVLLSTPTWTYIVDRTRLLLPLLILASLGSSALQWAYLSPGVGFLQALAVAVSQEIFAAPIFPMTDSLVLRLLGKDRTGYGQQRLWGALACGSAFVIASGFISYGYAAIFALHSFWTGVYVLILVCNATPDVRGRLPDDAVDDNAEPAAPADDDEVDEATPLAVDSGLKPGGEPSTGLGWVLAPSTLAFLASMAVLGAAFSVVGSFLWIYLKEHKGATRQLLGMTGPFSYAVQIPFFFFSKDV
ncbi:hypothetical protein HDU96_009996, partial [Phlyctochytrium bullatum]